MSRVLSSLVAAPLLLAATIPSGPDLGKSEGQCRANERGPAFLVDVNGLKDRKGRLKLEVYPANDNDFLADDNILVSAGKTFRRVEQSIPQTGPIQLCIRVPTAGTYAVTLLHDRDTNRKFGWRVDGIGFAGNPKLGLSKPRASQASAAASSTTTRVRSSSIINVGWECDPFLDRTEPMKIVDVCAFYSPRGGGVRTYVGQKLAVAEQMGHDITVLAPGDGHCVHELNGSARIITLPSPRFPLDRKYWYFHDEEALHRALDQLAPDLVEASSPWRSPLMLANWRPEVPKALIMHADPLSAYAYRWLEPLFARETIDRRMDRFWQHLRLLGNRFDAVVCANHDFGNRLSAGGVDNVVTIPMGVEPGLFTPQRRDESLRTQLLDQCDLGREATLLVAAGRLAPEKRIPLLVESATIAGQQRPIGLVIFGEGREQAAIVRSIGGNPHIRLFRPERDRGKFATILASCDALIHGCDGETFCMAAAEARASGIPVIVPDQGGAPDFARGGGGFIYRSADRNDLVCSILLLSKHSPGWCTINRGRSMGDHFRTLFNLYGSLVIRDRLKAA